MAGGPAPDADTDDGSDDDNDNEDEENESTKPDAKPETDAKPDPGDGMVPIAPQALPCKVILELMEAYQCKHLVDLWPSPNLAKHVVAMGGSYVGLCSTPAMHTQLRNALFNELISAIVNPAEKLLYDKRFAPAAANRTLLERVSHFTKLRSEF